MNGAPTICASTNQLGNSRSSSQAALAFVHQALVDSPATSWQPQPWLAGLAEAFQTAGAGFAILCGKTPAVQHWIRSDGQPITVCPWPCEEWPELRAEVRA